MPDGFMGSEQPFRSSRKQQGQKGMNSSRNNWYKLITIPAGSEASFHSDVEEEGVENLLITFFNLFFKMSNIAITIDNLQHHCSMYSQSFYLSQTAGDRH
ncbi:hypothetical protein T01_3519 [Trichinella spiralis]|uniref:Uncharacterized protein n=1 Tax=Trichinella spiralis TaxID=6334 RepID=A0A0V1BKC6_TRISP|nr:hypothetical protein T01_3519 [Trichinella spiralis]